MVLEVTVTTPGDGKIFPKDGDSVEFHYTGSYSVKGGDKTKFACSRESKKMVESKIGAEVVKGLDAALKKMSMGERAVAKVSADLAYGAEGCKDPAIPAGADLELDVELVAINGKKHYSAEQIVKFQAQLDKWATDKLAEYDKKPDFAAKRDAKHTNRAGYEEWLKTEVVNAIASKKSTLQDSKPKKAAAKGQAVSKEIGVTWEDQQRINEFGRLNHRHTEVVDDIAKKKNDLANLRDVAGDIECLLDDDACKIKVGEVYVEVPNDEAEEYVNAEVAEREEVMAGLEKEKASLEGQMSALKALLYAKFGNQINLETNPEE